jgi:hypothetical protein
VALHDRDVVTPERAGNTIMISGIGIRWPSPDGVDGTFTKPKRKKVNKLKFILFGGPGFNNYSLRTFFYVQSQKGLATTA